MSNSNPLSFAIKATSLSIALLLSIALCFWAGSRLWTHSKTESGTQVKPVPVPVPVEKHFKIVYQETIDSTTYTEFISPNGFFCVSVYGIGLHCYRNRVETGE